MATEVSSVARFRKENDIVPMDVSVLKGKAKFKDDKHKAEPKANPNKDMKCLYCDKIGHVKTDFR